MGTPLQKRSQVSAAGGWGGESNITRSAWFDGSADHLDRTPSSASSDRTRQIWGCWIRRTSFSANARGIFGAGTGATARVLTFLSTHEFYWALDGSSTATSVAVFRDTEWMHLVASYDGNETGNAERLKVYVNGVEIELTFSGTIPTTPQHFGDAVLHTIGSNTSVGNVMHGSLTQAFHIANKSIQNADHAITDFGESVTAGANGSIWAPRSDADIKTLVDAGGSNSFLISSAFGDGTDDSTNGNNFTPTSMSDATNGSRDTPSDPLIVWSTLSRAITPNNSWQLAEGGRFADNTAGGGLGVMGGSMSATAGDGVLYIEYEFSGSFAAGNGACIGISYQIRTDGARNHGSDNLNQLLLDSGDFSAIRDATDGTLTIENGGWTGTFAPGDTMGMEIDFDNDTIEFYKNGTSVGSPYTPKGTLAGKRWTIMCGDRTSISVNQDIRLNVHEDDWTGTPSTGAKAWKYSSLQTPAAQGADLFNAVTYSGDNTASQSQTGAGFQPDFVWAKGRTTASNNRVTDSSRGVQLAWQPDVSDFEVPETTGLLSFDSDGFTHGNLGGWGASFNYVAWLWKVNGGTTAANNDGDISSTVQVGDFMSIVQYTGNATSAQNVGHGLGAEPDMIIIKNRDTTNDPLVWFNAFSNQNINLSIAGLVGTNNGYFTGSNSTSVFQIGNLGAVNGSGEDFVAYVFRNMPGVCHVGSYIGNGSSDGSFFHTGFRPRWIMIKGSSSTSWRIYDTARDAFNEGAQSTLYADVPNAEVTNNEFDILANGIKLRTSASGVNSSGTTYYYIAIADVASGSGLPPIPGR